MYLKKLKGFWMGQVEEKIKTKLFSEIFADSFKVYEFIENRFELTHEEQEVIMKSISTCINDITIFLTDKKLS
jgi:hypothetical protein